MCPFCFATIALASAGAATSGGLTILAVRKFCGRDQSAKSQESNQARKASKSHETSCGRF